MKRNKRIVSTLPFGWRRVVCICKRPQFAEYVARLSKRCRQQGRVLLFQGTKRGGVAQYSAFPNVEKLPPDRRPPIV